MKYFVERYCSYSLFLNLNFLSISFVTFNNLILLLSFASYELQKSQVKIDLFPIVLEWLTQIDDRYIRSFQSILNLLPWAFPSKGQLPNCAKCLVSALLSYMEDVYLKMNVRVLVANTCHLSYIMLLSWQGQTSWGTLLLLLPHFTLLYLIVVFLFATGKGTHYT